MSIHPNLTLPGQLQNTLLQPIERSPLAYSKSRPGLRFTTARTGLLHRWASHISPLSQLLARSGKTSRERRKFHLITNPKESTAHTPQVLSFSSLGGRRRKPRAGEQGPVFHGVRPSPKAVDGTVQAAGPPTSLPAPTPGPPNPPRWARSLPYIPAPAGPRNRRGSSSLHKRRGLGCRLGRLPLATGLSSPDQPCNPFAF